MRHVTLTSLAAVAMALSLPGCATITTGTTQPLDVTSSPAGAECTLAREGARLGTVTTPGNLTIKRSRQPITVVCTKEGYEEGRTIMNSHAETTTYGNAIIGGIVGMAIDNSTGANGRYDPSVAVELTAMSAADQAAAHAKKEASVQVAAPAGSAGVDARVPHGSYDGTYEGGVDVLQTDISPPVAHRRDFSLQVRNGVATGTLRHVLCDQPGEVFLVIDSSGSIQGKANTQNTTGCTERMAMVEGRMDGSDMRLTLRLRGNPVAVLKHVSGSTTAPAVAAAPSAGQFDGEYRSGVELASGDLRQLWIRVRGAKATGTSRVALCPNPGAVSMNLDPSGMITGEADLQTSASCAPRKATLSGHAEGKRLVMTASFADGTHSREFTFNRLSRGAGVDD
jgi:hypothetical protein